MADEIRPFISVKLTPIGRLHSVPLPANGAPAAPPDAGAQVVVRVDQAAALGTVRRTPSALDQRRQPPPDSANTLVRVATREDIVARFKHHQREEAAYQFCLLKIRERALQMKLTRVEQLFDGSRLIFYFTAEGRVDFRELVRDLAAEFRMRIEMRQIGVRDEAKMLGGYGSCGRPLCCTTWLQSFEPVSIKMAKQQQLSLNPSKLSGLCGRLKCCLRYELPGARREGYAGAAHENPCDGCSGCSASAATTGTADGCAGCSGCGAASSCSAASGCSAGGCSSCGSGCGSG